MTTDSSTSADGTASTTEPTPTDDAAPTEESVSTDGVAPVEDYRDAIDDPLVACKETFDDLLDELTAVLSDDDTSAESSASESSTANGDRREP